VSHVGKSPSGHFFDLHFRLVLVKLTHKIPARVQTQDVFMGRNVPNAMVVRALDLASPDPQRPQTRWLARGVPLATGGQHGRQMPVLSTEGSQRGG